MKRKLTSAKKVGGTLSVPGDKSIAHRAALLSILASEPVVAVNYPDNLDCRASLEAARKFGVVIERNRNTVTFTPPSQLELPADIIIDCGNSATTARLLAGLVAGSNLSVILAGDESLSTRPMKRIIDPLREMGAEVFDQDGHLPLKIEGKKLLPFEYRLPVASAQVKSSLILAALASKCSLTLIEDIITRDHTEIMLAHFGEGLSIREIKPMMIPDPHDPRKKRMSVPEDFKKEIKLASHSVVRGGTVDIPGDISTAAFFMSAAAISGGTLTIENLGLNPTRTSVVEHLKNIGCRVEIRDKNILSGEPRGTVTVTGGPLKARKISGDTTAGLIDEIPIVAIMAAFAEGTTIIRDANELKVKECDRLEATAANLRKMGVKCGLLEDGLAIEGGEERNGADFESFGDHRIAMAFSVAALFLDGPSTIDDDSTVAVSCPEFYNLLETFIQ
ncbi:MAG: 3-phosphoshikimate 1-carboxyvinyltransferase [candidate division Zixibacteria bacterium]|nr:3-phosphoshikimate 1-carboxyvinyltransferase [candidate division Zixibacteria bacterium]